jgi:hypothetical protein bfra3_18821
MMKNKLLFLLVFGVMFFTSCSDDDDTTWKKIPQGEISAENITLNINGDQASTGTVQMTVKNESEAVLNLKNVIPGYTEIPVDVTLEKQADDSFTFVGEKGMTTPPSMLARAEASTPVILYVRVEGKVSLDGKASVTAATRLAEVAQGGLVGSWDLLRKPTMVGENTLTSAPLLVTWSAIDSEKPNMEEAANVVNLFGSSALSGLLNQITFHEDGNITAEYWTETSLEDIFGGMDEDGNFIALHEKWLDSPKGLVFWYVKSDVIYIVPNIDAIIKQINKDNGGEIVGSTEDMMTKLTAILEQLGNYNINVDGLLPTVMEWATTGIPLKYGVDNGSLKVYVDKDMATPFMTALLPALDVLQEYVDQILASEDENDKQTASLIKLALGLLGIDKLTDIQTIWAENTANFELSLNFVTKK